MNVAAKVAKVRLYWDTVRHLRPVQIRRQAGSRLRSRIYKSRKGELPRGIRHLAAPGTREVSILIPDLDCDGGYLGRFDAEGLLRGDIRLLHEEYHVGKEWNVPGASHLWNYNLHYLEFLVPLAAKYRETGDERYFNGWAELAGGWLAQAASDGMEPYTISMRIPNLLISMELLGRRLRGTGLRRKLLTSVYRQYRCLIRRQETALLANHYFENLKAIVISGLLFREPDVYRRHFRLLMSQIEEQVLPDGMHFELSPMYHRIILEDVLRVHAAMNSAHRWEDAGKLVPTIRRMAAAMESLERGFGRIPLFNDAGDNVAKGKTALLKAARGVCGPGVAGSGNLESAGYYKLYLGEAAVLFDCGPAGPSYMGGHAHCDCLSFELSVGGRVVLANSGTGQYQGELRAFFRSTAAHNTVMVDRREQSELWGEHRVGRRISRTVGAADGRGVTGQFRSFQGDLFRRRLHWEGDRTLVITDEVRTHDGGSHTARQFLHLAPGLAYVRGEGEVRIRSAGGLVATVSLPPGCDCLVHTDGPITHYAEEFGRYLRKQVLEIRTQFEDRIRLRTKIRIQEEGGEIRANG